MTATSNDSYTTIMRAALDPNTSFPFVVDGYTIDDEAELRRMLIGQASSLACKVWQTLAAAGLPQHEIGGVVSRSFSIAGSEREACLGLWIEAS